MTMDIVFLLYRCGMHVITWFLAASPTRRSESVKAIYDGVVRLPWSLATISTRSFCQTPTHEYVVPRSMPAAQQQAVVKHLGDGHQMLPHDCTAIAPHMRYTSRTSVSDQRLTYCWGRHGAKRHSAVV